jgi:hypothetical protein
MFTVVGLLASHSLRDHYSLLLPLLMYFNMESLVGLSDLAHIAL